MGHDFVDHFWDQDFNGATGYDTLINRLKEGKKFCDTFTDFIRNRAKIEDEYGRQLIRLAQVSANNEEIGTLRASWEAVRKEAENVGKVHCEMAKKYSDLLERTAKFREQQKVDRYKIDEKMKKLQKDKKTAYDNVIKAKKTYDSRCRESDQAKEVYEGKSSYTPKEEDRLKRNMLKAKTTMESADSIYQSAIKYLEDYRKKWILEMEDSSQQFQSFEEARIQFLRNEIWVYTNLGTLQAIEIDSRYEDCRKVLEKCNEAADIQIFIAAKHTGSERPAPIPYENYYHGLSTPVMSNSDSSQSIGSSGRNSTPDIMHNNKTGSLGRAVLPHKPMNQNRAPQGNSRAIVEDAYSTIVDLHEPLSSKVTVKPRVRVAFDYNAQGHQELNLKVGDIVEIHRIEDSAWAIGSLNGRIGAFPRQFVEEL